MSSDKRDDEKEPMGRVTKVNDDGTVEVEANIWDLLDTPQFEAFVKREQDKGEPIGMFTASQFNREQGVQDYSYSADLETHNAILVETQQAMIKGLQQRIDRAVNLINDMLNNPRDKDSTLKQLRIVKKQLLNGID